MSNPARSGVGRYADKTVKSWGMIDKAMLDLLTAEHLTVTNINLRFDGNGWLLVVKASDGLNKRIQFRNLTRLSELQDDLFDVLTTDRWREDKPYVPKL